MSHPKSLLFVLRRGLSPEAPLNEPVEMILTAAAFDQAVSVLFLDGAVELLIRREENSAADSPSPAQLLEAFELYDLQRLLVEQESLEARGLDAVRLVIPVEIIPRAAVAELAAGHDAVIALD